jgi:hypothetical protein
MRLEEILFDFPAGRFEVFLPFLDPKSNSRRPSLFCYFILFYFFILSFYVHRRNRIIKKKKKVPAVLFRHTTFSLSPAAVAAVFHIFGIVCVLCVGRTRLLLMASCWLAGWLALFQIALPT